MGNGEVWTFGGMDEAGADSPDHTIERYDLATNSWSLVGGQNLPGQWEEAYNRLTAVKRPSAAALDGAPSRKNGRAR